ncbi:hypothetical protein HOLleu_09241 [Holothuria leucospilota]|uniref:Reverse transcriptase RNase H-like domain-containing protein n=1 Tax=Holothuria leucospilota TaxID=206669 RepID=A0A9Q1CIU0_HOLLE|nr:hypothetical protein HOLleu_09241 [Holothuria leucospilota]
MLYTDHKPLRYLLGPNKGIPVLAASRLQRWAILLSGYEYDITYCSSKQNANVDCLSRLPVSSRDVSSNTREATKMNESQIDCLPVSASEIAKATMYDRVLSRVLHFVLYGWPNRNSLSPELLSFYDKRDESSVEGKFFSGVCM